MHHHSDGISTRTLKWLFLLGLTLSGCAGVGPSPGERAPLTERQREAALKALVGPDEYADYVLLTDTAEAADWLRKFWIRHDPTPTTKRNEFKQEHERRVYHAIYLFGGHSQGGRPWDDRGEVYIRYGQPDERLIRRSGLDDDGLDRNGGLFDELDHPLNHKEAATEVWTYYQWNETFQFEDRWGFSAFELAPVTDPFSEREDITAYYRNRLRAVDLQPAIYYHEYGKNLIDYSLDVVRFQGDDGNWRVDVNLGYPLSELARGRDSITIAVQRTLIVRDEDEREVYAEGGRIQRIVGPHDSNRLMVEQKILDLPPSRYTLAVTIDDLNSGKSGTYIKTFRLPEYIVTEIQEISDIELASYVWSIYEPGASFVKEDHMVVPLPSRVYLPDQQLAFYYEAYNLLINEQGSTDYSVKYEIAGAEGDFKKEYTPQDGGEYSGDSRDARLVGTVDIDDLSAGEYFLTVRVTDNLGKHEKSAITRFKKSD